MMMSNYSSAASYFAQYTPEDSNDSFLDNEEEEEEELGFIGPLPILEEPPDSNDLLYPIQDQRFGYRYSNQSVNPFDLTPNNSNVEYDPNTGQYVITDPTNPNAAPRYMSFDEYWEEQDRESMANYWESQSGSSLSNPSLGSSNIIPKLNIGNDDLAGIFNGNEVDIRPSGGIELLAGWRRQRIENPVLQSLGLANQGALPEFQMTPNLSVQGKIGDNLNFNINYSTQATFDFENQVRLEYTGDEDDIIQKIEAGNVNFQLPTALIPGSQSLFGLKTKLKFGRLTATSVISQQKSRADRITIQNGSQIKDFVIRTDEFEENRHFFLSQYFKDNYNKALSTMPCITSEVQINYVEVWVSNRRNQTTETRNIVAMMDLGETDPHRQPNILPRTQDEFPRNQGNSLYSDLLSNGDTRSIDKVTNALQNELGLVNINDFRLAEARRLDPNEFTFDPQLGFISLNAPLQSDDIVGVAFEYQTIWGDTYRVGEFADQLPPNINDNGREQVMFVKMLKSIRPEPSLPIWDLMMRNVYKIPQAYKINEEDFRLNVFYEVPGGGASAFLPDGPSVRDKVLISLLGLDRLNFQDDPKPDGVVDFFTAKANTISIDAQEGSQYNQNEQNNNNRNSGFGNSNSNRNRQNARNQKFYSTIDPRTGRVYFPVREPFGEDLAKQFDNGEENIAASFTYPELYDTTLTIARQFPEKNRFLIKGRYKSGTSSEFSLGSFNLPENSIKVRAGGKELQEGTDYTVNYSLGRVSILNDAYLNSGIPIHIDYEDPALFSIQQKTYFGTRLDYWINDDFTLGGTYVHLSQRPFTQKVNYGDDAISNRMLGLDANYYKEAPGITRALNKLPLYSTKEKSSVTFAAEGAKFIPGHAKAIDLGSNGVVFLDDFEGTQSQIPLDFPYNDWQFASTPSRFPNSELSNDWKYNYDRARFAWYIADPGANVTGRQSSHYTRSIDFDEVFPRTATQFINNLRPLDVTYYPDERGPYNFNVDDLTPDGKLDNPSKRWGGMMRQIDQPDFQFNNIEFIEFWVMDPFLEDNTNDGTMYFNLGTISEDILKDGRRSFENGLPSGNQPENTDTTKWGRVSKNNVINRFFGSDTTARNQQDIGLDGLTNEGESVVFNQYLEEITAKSDLSDAAKAQILNDPANDDFLSYNDAAFNENDDLLTRYKRFNSPEGNSGTASQGRFSTSSTNRPDNEDINEDNALEQAESYFEYKIPLEANMQVGDSYITNIRESEEIDGVAARWLKFQIPIAEFESAVGDINQFTAIQFMRMYLTDFERPVTLRFADFNLVRNFWRRYETNIFEEGEYQPTDNLGNSKFNVTSVSVEQHFERQPVQYRLPPGTIQEEIFNGASTALIQNEQSLSLQVCDLEDGVGNIVFKTERYDMRQFKRLNMWVHAEEGLNATNTLEDNDVSAIIRIGSDLTANYYEYEVPLSVTAPTSYTTSMDSEEIRNEIWPYENRVDLTLKDLVDLKKTRNFVLDGFDARKPYTQIIQDTILSKSGEFIPVERKLTVVGSPDLGQVTTMALGVRNPKRTKATEANDNGSDECAEVWFNELSLSEFDESGGYAALARMDVKLADLGNITVSGNMHTAGFGTLEQRVIERSQDNLLNYDATANINLDKFLPEKSGIKIPMYAGVSESISNPKYDPYNTDVIMKEALDSIGLYQGQEKKKEYKKNAQEYTNIKSLNFTNVRKVRTNQKKKQRIYDIENFNVSASYTEVNYRDPIIEAEKEKRYRGEIGYAYNTRPKYITPFNKLIKSQNPWMKMIKDVNFNLIPSSLSFRTEVNRLFSQTKYRNLIGDKFTMPTLYNKDFVWGRYYGFKYDITKNLGIDFNATNLSRIDEPAGAPGENAKSELWDNFKDLGRTINYSQSANANFNVPIDKIPVFDWTKLRAKYGTNYEWVTGPLVAVDSLDKGNIIMNQTNLQLNGELNFSKLYGKSKFLKNIDRPSKKRPKREKGKGEKEPANPDGEKAKKEKGTGEISPGLRAVLSPLLMLKRASLTWTNRLGTEIPGFTPRSSILGQDWGGGKAAPGVDFLFGMQPDTTWLNNAAGKGWMTTSTLLNRQFRQTKDRNLQGKATLEPFKGFKIDLTLTKNYRETYVELFKVNRDGEFEHMTPNGFGSYSVSYIPFKTAWDAVDDSTLLSNTFYEFEENRSKVSQRLAEGNLAATGEYFNPSDSTFLSEYSRGYGPYAQDVLIPAFLAAYKGVDVNTIDLDGTALKQRPLPNWSVTWNGLSKIKFFKKFLSSVNLSHRYNSTYTVNSFRTEPFYQGRVYNTDRLVESPYLIDSLSGNFFVPVRIPDIQISEQFAPLLGIDMTFNNSLTTRFEFSKRRTIGLSLIDYQLNENKGTEFIIGAGYQIAGVKLPFKNKDGSNIVLENDLTFQFDLSISDNLTSIYAFDQEITQPTNGSKTIRFSPTIDYVINDQIRLTLYYEYEKMLPYTTQSFVTTRTRGGIRVNFSLAQ